MGGTARTEEHARRNAKANSRFFRVPYVYYRDPLKRWQVKPLSMFADERHESAKKGDPSWTGVTLNPVVPSGSPVRKPDYDTPRS